MPSLRPPGNVRGTRERDPSLLRLMVRAVVLFPGFHRNRYRLDDPRDIVRSICSTIAEIHATHVWYATIEVILLELID